MKDLTINLITYFFMASLSWYIIDLLILTWEGFNSEFIYTPPPIPLSPLGLVTGADVKKFLTFDEIQDIESLGKRNSRVTFKWESAIFTGSRAFGNNRIDSDLDICFCMNDFCMGNIITDLDIYDDWKIKPLNDNQNEDYPETYLNITNGRLNIFFVDGEYWHMYHDATKICLNGGTKKIFKQFVAVAHDRGWYE